MEGNGAIHSFNNQNVCIGIQLCTGHCCMGLEHICDKHMNNPNSQSLHLTEGR